MNKKIKVICDGNHNYHQCEERKCKHRNPHIPKGHCKDSKRVNDADAWCIAPGTISPLDGQVDGALVKCIKCK